MRPPCRALGAPQEKRPEKNDSIFAVLVSPASHVTRTKSFPPLVSLPVHSARSTAPQSVCGRSNHASMWSGMDDRPADKTCNRPERGDSVTFYRIIETQPSRFVRHTRRCEAEFPVPISDAGGCETKKNDSPPRGIKSRPESPKANFFFSSAAKL